MSSLRRTPVRHPASAASQSSSLVAGSTSDRMRRCRPWSMGCRGMS
jgi:hypothetical protein